MRNEDPDQRREEFRSRASSGHERRPGHIIWDRQFVCYNPQCRNEKLIADDGQRNKHVYHSKDVKNDPAFASILNGEDVFWVLALHVWCFSWSGRGSVGHYSGCISCWCRNWGGFWKVWIHIDAMDDCPVCGCCGCLCFRYRWDAYICCCFWRLETICVVGALWLSSGQISQKHCYLWPSRAKFRAILRFSCSLGLRPGFW